MAANTLRKSEPSRRAFESRPYAACGSDCGRLRSCAPRSAETMLVDSRKSIRRSQDSSAFGGAALIKSMESRPPSDGRRDTVEGIDRVSPQGAENEVSCCK